MKNKSSENTRNSWGNDGIKGKVKNRVDLEYNVIGEQKEVLKRKTVYVYNEDGNKIEISEYNADDSSRMRTIFTYDNSGNKIEELVFVPASVLHSKSIYKYNSFGEISEIVRYSAFGSIMDKYVYEYDEKNSLSVMSLYKFSNNTPTTKYVYKFSSEGLLRKVVATNSDDNPDNKNIYKYNMEKDVKKQLIFHAVRRYYDGSYYWYPDFNWHPDRVIKYKYDKSRNIKKEVENEMNGVFPVFNNNTDGSKTIYEYDSAGNQYKISIFIKTGCRFLLFNKYRLDKIIISSYEYYK